MSEPERMWKGHCPWLSHQWEEKKMENCATCMAINKKDACLYCTEGSRYEKKRSEWKWFEDEMQKLFETIWVLRSNETVEQKKVGHIDHMVSFPGGDATPKLIDNNFSQLYRKINELVDAVNDINRRMGAK